MPGVPCPHGCGATLDVGEHCDCQGAQQLDWKWRQKHSDRAALAMLGLKDRLHRVPKLEDYIAWGNMSLVPNEEIAQVAADLEAEVKMKKALGMDLYQDTKGLDVRLAIYREAMEAMCEELQHEERVGASWAELRRRFSECVKRATMNGTRTEKGA